MALNMLSIFFPRYRHPEREHLTSSTYAPHSVIHTPLGPIGLLICWDLAFPEAFRELIAAGAKMIIIPTFCTNPLIPPFPFHLPSPPLTPYTTKPNKPITTMKPPDFKNANSLVFEKKKGTLADCNPYGLSQNPHSEALFMSSTLTARAFENTCAIVFVNAGGPAPSTSHSDPSSSHPGAESLADATSPYAGLSRVSLPFVGGLACETKESGAEGMSIVDVDMELVEQAEANYKVREDLGRGDWHYEYRHRRMERGK